MKKKLSKNYIAFTLTEMTMVLLIMSVIAAVSAPLVKHAVSDVTNNSEPTKRGGIWRKINNLDGIFYSSVGNGMVSVNYKPTADPINYDYPTMIINTDMYRSPIRQIGFYAQRDGNSMGLTNYHGIHLEADISMDDSTLRYRRDALSPSYGRITIGHFKTLNNNWDDVLIGSSDNLGSFATQQMLLL